MSQDPERKQTVLRFCLAVIAALFLLMGAKQVLAAVPTNDAFTSPLVVPNLPFSDVADTTEATTDADDAQLNSTCGAPATDASVWYVFTPAENIDVVIDTSGSDYTAGILVGVGTQGNLQTVTCGPGAVGFSATAGTTYYVLAIDDQFDGGGNGGNLVISFTGFPVPELDITVNRFGQFNSKTGTATISGTYSCSNSDFISVSGDARQAVGRIATISGFFGFSDAGTCDGAPHTWSAEVFPNSGKFKGGKTMTVTFSFSCGPIQCAFGFDEKTVQLRGGSGRPHASGASTHSGYLFLPSISTEK